MSSNFGNNYAMPYLFYSDNLTWVYPSLALAKTPVTVCDAESMQLLITRQGSTDKCEGWPYVCYRNMEN